MGPSASQGKTTASAVIGDFVLFLNTSILMLKDGSGENCTIPRGDLERTRVEYPSPGRTVLILEGRDRTLASIDIPGRLAGEIQQWIKENLGL